MLPLPDEAKVAIISGDYISVNINAFVCSIVDSARCSSCFNGALKYLKNLLAQLFDTQSE